MWRWNCLHKRMNSMHFRTPARALSRCLPYHAQAHARFSSHAHRRVVVTGLGMVSPLGVGVRSSWEGLLSDRPTAHRMWEWDGAGSSEHAHPSYLWWQPSTQPSSHSNTRFGGGMTLDSKFTRSSVLRGIPVRLAAPVPQARLLSHEIEEQPSDRTSTSEWAFPGCFIPRQYRAVTESLFIKYGYVAALEALLDAGIVQRDTPLQNAPVNGGTFTECMSEHSSLASPAPSQPQSDAQQWFSAAEDVQWNADCGFTGEDVGVVIGSGVGSLEDSYLAAVELLGPSAAELPQHDTSLDNGDPTYPSSRGYRGVSPLALPRFLPNMAAGLVSMAFQLSGPNMAPSTACTTGAHSIIEAASMIRQGMCTAAVVGATEASVNVPSMALFARCRALTPQYDADPSLASRPFSPDRSGFLMGEGAGMLVLEERETALARGAHIYAELTGGGASGDAHHVTAPPEDGRGAAACMQQALSEHNRRCGEENAVPITYVNAHATSTPLGDMAECRAIYRVHCDPAGDAHSSSAGTGTVQASEHDTKGPHESQQNPVLWVSSTKGATGHCLGGAGAIEGIFSVLALHTQTLPHTRNLHDLSDIYAALAKESGLCDHDTGDSGSSDATATAVAHSSSSQDTPDGSVGFVVDAPLSVAGEDGPTVQAAMSNSFGFGGTNASVVFTHPDCLPRGRCA